MLLVNENSSILKGGATPSCLTTTATPPCTLQWAEAEGHTATVALIRQHVQAVQAATTSPAAPEEPALHALDGDDGARSSQLEPHSCLSCAAACQHPSLHA
mgnify:CR=1 FL=1